MTNTTSFETIVDAVLQNNVEAVKQFLLSGERLTSRCFHAYQSVEMLQLFETQHIDLQHLDLVQLLLPRALFLWKQTRVDTDIKDSCLYYLCKRHLGQQTRQKTTNKSEHHLSLKHLIEQELKLQKMELSEHELNMLLTL